MLVIDNFPSIALVLEQAAEVERDAILRIISGAYSAEKVASALRRNGFDASASTIRTFRRELAREGASQ